MTHVTVIERRLLLRIQADRPSTSQALRFSSSSVIHQLIACAVESCLQPHNRAEVVIRQC